MARPVAIEAIVARVKVRSRKRVSGMSGSATRSSVTTNRTVATATPPSIHAVVVLAQSKSRPALVTQISSSAVAAVRNTMPR